MIKKMDPHSSEVQSWIDPKLPISNIKVDSSLPSVWKLKEKVEILKKGKPLSLPPKNQLPHLWSLNISKQEYKPLSPLENGVQVQECQQIPFLLHKNHIKNIPVTTAI